MEIVIITGIAFVFSILLVVADDKMNRKSKYEREVLNLLPGYNCGACGFGSCSGMAEAIKKDPANYQKCKPLRGSQREKLEAFLEEKKRRKKNDKRRS